ncbi:MAG: hypothetical protein Q9208_006671 [Pyrenodesmia sp. 3 TL-2023]
MDFPDDIYSDPQRLFNAMAANNPNLPVPQFLSFQDAKRQAGQYSKDIFTAQNFLINVLDRYEETLIKRWLKKTSIQRQKVLTAALPGIPPTHRPDFWAIRKESPAQIRAGTQYRDRWLLPSLNLEDLSKPKNLVLFLRSRARHPPGVFVNADANSVHIGHVAQAVMPAYLSGYTMLLSGQDTEKAYGRMLSWEEDDGAFDMMSRGTGLQPGEGLQVMEIQQRKMQFLEQCVEIILQDLRLRDPSIPKQPLPADDLLVSRAAEWPSLSQEVEEAPYTVPDPFEIGRLRAFVLARRDEAEDHIWSLREDPSYFQDVVLEWSEHRQEKLLTASGKTHPVLRHDLFWERVLSNVVMDAYSAFVAWDIVTKEVDNLVYLKAGHRIRPNQEPPIELAQALAHFGHLIDQTVQGPISKWKAGMPASPPLRQYWVREPQEPNTTIIRVKSKDSSRTKGDHLLWLLEVFLQDEQLFLCGLENVCDELEREIRSSQASRDRISPYIANLISELSLLGELKRQIGLTTPGPRLQELIDPDELRAEYDRKAKLFSQVSKCFNNMNTGLAEVGSPLEKFNYPANKRRTSATTQKMQQAEKSLDLFWSHVDDHCKRIAGKTVHQILSRILGERQLQRTPDWIEPDKKGPPKEGSTEVDTTSSQLAALELESRTESTITTSLLAQERQKPKTRGIPRTVDPATTEEPNGIVTPEEKDTTPVFNVSKRGFKVFSTLFYSPTAGEPPGELPWSEFLSAMASVGFSIKKLDGSAWVFAPANDEWKQSIIFHEPHPSSKIPFQVARRFGRRLWRTYGWNSGNFKRV